MDNYKVVLVDDEVEVIDAIEQRIHWDILGFEVVGSAISISSFLQDLMSLNMRRKLFIWK